jgi:hypothetical protein
VFTVPLHMQPSLCYEDCCFELPVQRLTGGTTNDHDIASAFRYIAAWHGCSALLAPADLATSEVAPPPHLCYLDAAFFNPDYSKLPFFLQYSLNYSSSSDLFVTVHMMIMSSTCDICTNVLKYYRSSIAMSPMRNETQGCLVHGHHRSFQSFERSVKENCYICGILWRTQSRLVQKTLQDEYNDYAIKLSETSFFTEISIGWAESEVGIVGVVFSVPGLNKKPCSFECTKIPGMFFFYHVTLWLTIFLATPMSSDTTSSTESIRVARDWLHDCLEHHPGCKQSDSGVSWYPTRLLYLGETSNDDTNVRLIHTAQNIPTGPYMTLSHRWGSADFLKLTRATMPVFCNTIVLEDLPKTFRDAIIVTKTLGI